MIVFVAGMSRSGSMWTYNIVRAIYETTDFSVLPKAMPADERALIRDALSSAVKNNEVHCIKTHFLFRRPIPTSHEVKFICNIRDVRDACISFMRFTHSNFERGVSAMTSMMNSTDYYLSEFGNSVLGVRFEDVTNNPLIVVNSICSFLKIELSDSDKNEIISRFSKTKIKKKLHDMSKIRLDANGQIEGDEQQSKFEAIKNLDGTYRIYDKTTAFQSNHITSTGDGEWRTVFDKDQIEKVNSISKEWLLRHGYTI